LEGKGGAIMAQSEALKIAKLEARTQLQSQVLGLLTDPLWSTIGGFVTVHELRRRDMIGPVADDILYAGIIAINTARQPALAELAGKGISAALAVAGGVAGGVGAVAAGKVAGKVGVGLLAKTSGKAAGVALLPVGIATSLAVKTLQRKGYMVEGKPSGLGGGKVYKT